MSYYDILKDVYPHVEYVSHLRKYVFKSYVQDVCYEEAVSQLSKLCVELCYAIVEKRSDSLYDVLVVQLTEWEKAERFLCDEEFFHILETTPEHIEIKDGEYVFKDYVEEAIIRQGIERSVLCPYNWKHKEKWYISESRELLYAKLKKYTDKLPTLCEWKIK
jgi:hypothetical protein